QKTAYEIFTCWSSDVCSSDLALRSASSQVRARKSAAEPQARRMCDADFIQCEPVELVIRDAPGQRFGALLEQFRRRTAQNQKARRSPWPIGHDAQDGEELGP